MKNKVKSLILTLILTFVVTLNVNALTTVKEADSTYEGATYIIGSTRFDKNSVLTISSVTTAVSNEYVLKASQGISPSEVNIAKYYRSGLDGTWYEVTDSEETGLKTLSTAEVTQIKENLNIYYVNNEEKVLTFEYTGSIDVNTLPKEVKYENGVLNVPATIFQFDFETEDGKNVSVSTSDIESSDGALKIHPYIEISMEKEKDVYYTNNELKVNVLVDGNDFTDESYDVRYFVNGQGCGYVTDEPNYIENVKLDKENNEFSFNIIAQDVGKYFIYFQIVKPSEYGYEEIIAIESKEINFVLGPSATVEYKGGITPNEYSSITFNNKGTEVYVNSGTVNWYPVDESVGRYASGNRFGFKITAPEEYQNEKIDNVQIERTMYYNNDDYMNPTKKTSTMTWGDVKDGDYYYETWPLITRELQKIEIKLYWEEDNVQTITIYVNGVELESAPKATISYISGLSEGTQINSYDIEEGTVYNISGGSIAWYPVDKSVGRYAAGNRFGFKITAPEKYSYNDYKDAKIIRRTYYINDETPEEPRVETKEMTWKDVQDSNKHYETWPLIEDGAYKVEIEITWEESNVQLIAFEFGGMTLDLPPSGMVSYIAGVDGSIDGPISTSEGIVFDIFGTVKWYPADESVGRIYAGNRFGFKITAPEKYSYEDYKDAKIIRRTYYINDETPEEPRIETKEMTWKDVQDSNEHYETWPLIEDGAYKVEIEITWEEGNIQKIIFNFSGVTLEPAQE